jgi:hypothetical protein
MDCAGPLFVLWRSNSIGLAPESHKIREVRSLAPNTSYVFKYSVTAFGALLFEPQIHRRTDKFALRAPSAGRKPPQAVVLMLSQVDLGSHH